MTFCTVGKIRNFSDMKKMLLKWDSNRNLSFIAHLKSPGLNPCEDSEFFTSKKEVSEGPVGGAEILKHHTPHSKLQEDGKKNKE